MRCQDWIHNPKTTHTKRFHWDEKASRRTRTSLWIQGDLFQASLPY